jgi:fimbrial chaperone protein
MTHRFPTGPWAPASLCLCAALSAHAATFSINPLRVELGARQRTDIVTLRNTADAPLRLQVRTMQWTVADDGQWQLSPSNDLIVTPELTEVPAGGSAQFRVGTLIEPGATEGSYRLLIDELPVADGDTPSQSQIRVLTQISMPVFIEAAKRVRIPAIGGVTVAHGELSIAIGNTGTQRMDPTGIKVAVLDTAGQVLDQRDVTANYVLPGRNWFMNLKLSAEACRRATQVSVTWPDIAATKLTQAIATDSRACEDSASH